MNHEYPNFTAFKRQIMPWRMMLLILPLVFATSLLGVTIAKKREDLINSLFLLSIIILTTIYLGAIRVLDIDTQLFV